MSEARKTRPSEQVPLGPSSRKQMDELEVLIRARYPLIYVISWEEQRVVAQVSKIAAKLGKNVFEWSINTGLVPAGTSIQSQKHKDSATQDPLVALGNVIEHVEPALYVFKDFHPFLKAQNMSVIRRMREVAASLKNTFKTIILVSPMFQMPAELEKDLTVVDFDLPKENDFTALLGRIIEEVKENPKLDVNIDSKMREQIVHALLGLTLSEGENVLAKTLVQHRGFGQKSLTVINSEKKQIIRKNGLLQYYEAEEKMESVGGLDALKSWLTKRDEFNNLIVTHTFSKAYGLAGIRLGACYANNQVIDLLKKIRADERFAKLPFLMITAEAEQANVVIAVKAGVSNFIVKPFSIVSLQEKFNKVFP
jgi:ActR/RegA family two-component response regulator